MKHSDHISYHTMSYKEAQKTQKTQRTGSFFFKVQKVSQGCNIIKEFLGEETFWWANMPVSSVRGSINTIF